MLGAAAASLATIYSAWVPGHTYGRAAELTGKVFGRLLDLQVLLGLILYALSPIARMGLSDLGAAMAVKELRFFSVEHITGMLLAIAFTHVGTARIERARTDIAKLRSATIWRTIAVLTMLASIPWWRPFARI